MNPFLLKPAAILKSQQQTTIRKLVLNDCKLRITYVRIAMSRYVTLIKTFKYIYILFTTHFARNYYASVATLKWVRNARRFYSLARALLVALLLNKPTLEE